MSVPIRYFLADGGNFNFEAFYVGFPQVVFDSSGKRRISISPSHTYESRAVDTTDNEKVGIPNRETLYG